MIILAVETSCDETSAAILAADEETNHISVLSNVISSQIDFHRKYGGIVPELAARKHVEVISPIIKEALDKANITFKDLNAVAVTYGPGLVGSLLVGLSSAKAIAWSLNIPLIGVNHLEGHIYANQLTQVQNYNDQDQNKSQNTNLNFQRLEFPYLCLLVSGGHTMLVLVKEPGKYEVIGRTRDDAAGEAFDKVARVLNLGYPGGPIIDRLAKSGNPAAINFKRPMLIRHGGIEKGYGYDFSFSGLKTAVVNLVKSDKRKDYSDADLAASFQQAVVDVLVEKTIQAALANNCHWVALAGGVSANSLLRSELQKKGEEAGLQVSIPSFEYCTDNAAMIGAAALDKLKLGEVSDFSLAPVASLKL